MQIKSNTYEKVCHLISSNIRDKVKHNSHVVLGLATGSTPIGIYQELSKMRDTNFSDTITFNLDEYVGLNGWHPQSYNYFMYEHLFKSLTFKKRFFPNKDNYNEYDLIIKNAGGIDIQILGIGTNGHIAFNEPGSSFLSRTRVVNLDEQTIQDNSRFFGSVDDTPKQAITMGLGTIMESKKIILMANGKHKLNILNVAMNDEVTEDVPASILQNHNNVEVYYCD